MATRSVFADRKRRGPIEPRAGASWAHYFRLKALWPPELSLLHVAAPGRACWIRPELAGREQINSWRDAGCLSTVATRRRGFTVIVTLAAMAALEAPTADAAARQSRPAPTTEATAPREAGEPIMAIVCRS